MSSYKDTEICELILKCRERDDEAFSELVRRYTPMIRKVISLFLSPQRDFDEYFNEACVALHSAMRTFDVQQKDVTFGLYARRCVHNKIIDIMRKEKTNFKLPEFDDEELSVKGPESLICERERFEFVINKAAELLSDYEYKVLMLHIQGCTTAVIAKTLDKSAKSVDNAKFRLFTRLRSALAGVLDN